MSLSPERAVRHLPPVAASLPTLNHPDRTKVSSDLKDCSNGCSLLQKKRKPNESSWSGPLNIRVRDSIPGVLEQWYLQESQ